MPPCSRQNSVGVVVEVERSGGKKKLQMKDLLVHGVYEVCSEVLSGVFSSLTTPQCGCRTSTLCLEKCEEETGHKPKTIQTKDMRFLPLTMRHFMKECSSFVKGPSVL